MRRLALASLAFLAATHAATPNAIAPFSGLEPRPGVPAGWREVRLGGIDAPAYALERDGGVTVLRVRSVAAAGSIAHPLDLDASARPRISWRWKVDRVVEAADLERKSGDDFAARVYVFVDLPDSELPFMLRTKLRLARLVYGTQMPAGALCYVWDNRHAPGTMRPNPFAPTVRTVVLQSGTARAGTWVEESRDVEADFRAAFGYDAAKPMPRITGVAVGNDTDQTREAATAWFGDLRVEPRP